jgi:septal ring factor EnvC (AmiA/AmiB activator)
MNPKEKTQQEIENLEKDIKSLDDTWSEISAKDDMLTDVMRGISKRKEKLNDNLRFLKRTRVWSEAVQSFNYDNLITTCLKVMNNENESRKYNFTLSDAQDAWYDLKELGLQVYRIKKHFRELAQQTSKLEKSYIYLP